MTSLSRRHRTLYCFVVAGLFWATTPSQASAVTITGIAIYSADETGNPSGVRTDLPVLDLFSAHLWRTFVDPRTVWYGLGVLAGLPPESVDGALLNADDFTVDISLSADGEHFTFLAEPGPVTWSDDFDNWVLNLYFDGDVITPGISVVVPRFADPDDAPLTPDHVNRGRLYSLDLSSVDSAASFAYESGGKRVTVRTFSFLPPEDAGVFIDRIGSRSFGGSGVAEGIGVLTVVVEELSTMDASDDGCVMSRSGSASVWPLVIGLSIVVVGVRCGQRRG